MSSTATVSNHHESGSGLSPNSGSNSAGGHPLRHNHNNNVINNNNVLLDNAVKSEVSRRDTTTAKNCHEGNCSGHNKQNGKSTTSRTKGKESGHLPSSKKAKNGGKKPEKAIFDSASASTLRPPPPQYASTASGRLVPGANYPKFPPKYSR